MTMISPQRCFSSNTGTLFLPAASDDDNAAAAAAAGDDDNAAAGGGVGGGGGDDDDDAHAQAGMAQGRGPWFAMHAS